MNRWSQVIALGVLLGLIVATANYFYQASQYSRFSGVLAERAFLSQEIKKFNRESGGWPRSIGDLPPKEEFEGWTLEFLSENDGRARFRVKKGQHEREITVTGQPSTNAAKDDRKTKGD